MLIAYEPGTGVVVWTSGTNSAYPDGPPDDVARVATGRADLVLLRLHDVEQVDLVQATFTHRVLVVDGQLAVGDRLPEPPPPASEAAPPSGQWAVAADARITALSSAVAALMTVATLPDVDDDVLGELDGLDTLPPAGAADAELDDILSELEGL